MMYVAALRGTPDFIWREWSKDCLGLKFWEENFSKYFFWYLDLSREFFWVFRTIWRFLIVSAYPGMGFFSFLGGGGRGVKFWSRDFFLFIFVPIWSSPVTWNPEYQYPFLLPLAPHPPLVVAVFKKAVMTQIRDTHTTQTSESISFINCMFNLLLWQNLDNQVDSKQVLFA